MHPDFNYFRLPLRTFIMIKDIITVSAISTVLAITGCAAVDDIIGFKSGNPASQEILNSFSNGLSTESDIISALGSPQDYRQIDGNKLLIYKYSSLDPEV